VQHFAEKPVLLAAAQPIESMVGPLTACRKGVFKITGSYHLHLLYNRRGQPHVVVLTIYMFTALEQETEMEEC